jgi:hypothetical protein
MGMATTQAGATSAERRAHMRWSPPAGDLAIKLRVGDARHACRLRDISAGGAALVPDVAVDVDSQVVVELNEALALHGRVYRRRNDAIVIKFDLAPGVARKVEQAIQLGLAPGEW